MTAETVGALTEITTVADLEEGSAVVGDLALASAGDPDPDRFNRA